LALRRYIDFKKGDKKCYHARVILIAKNGIAIQKILKHLIKKDEKGVVVAGS
jgi:hypothetical protein